MTHYHFLDESGDPGLSGVAASSSHFALAMVQLPVREPVPELARVRQLLRLSPTFEFKYHSAKPLQKVAFFEAIRKTPFRVRAVVIDKAGLDKRFAAMRGQDFAVEFIARLTVRAPAGDIANDILVIDGATLPVLRALRLRLSAECRKMGRVHPFRKIVSGNSGSYDGLQIADMIVGAIAHHVMGVASGYYKTFQKKVADLWIVS